MLNCHSPKQEKHRKTTNNNKQQQNQSRKHTQNMTQQKQTSAPTTSKPQHPQSWDITHQQQMTTPATAN